MLELVAIIRTSYDVSGSRPRSRTLSSPFGALPTLSRQTLARRIRSAYVLTRSAIYFNTVFDSTRETLGVDPMKLYRVGLDVRNGGSRSRRYVEAKNCNQFWKRLVE